MNKNIKLISLGAYGRAGKDTFYLIAKNILEKNGYNSIRMAFAEEVKRDLDPFLKEKVGISAFTENTEEKNLIRPFIVAYSTTLMRKINPNIWIDKLREHIKSFTSDLECFRLDTDIIFIADLRFENEVDMLKNEYDGKCIHVKKYYYDNDGKKWYNPPANDEELKNDPLVQLKSDILIEWPEVKEDTINNPDLNKIVLDTLNKLDYFSGKLHQ